MRLHNSTIRIKQRTCISCGKPCAWFSRKRCMECARIEDTIAQDKETEEEDLTGLIEDADALVSRFVRMSSADKDGNCKCYTCGSKHSWRQMQAGHYISRKCFYLRHDLRNIRVQCVICNTAKYGMAAKFAQNLEKEQEGLPELLLEQSRVVYHITRDELRFIISDFTNKINKLK